MFSYLSLCAPVVIVRSKGEGLWCAWVEMSGQGTRDGPGRDGERGSLRGVAPQEAPVADPGPEAPNTEDKDEDGRASASPGADADGPRLSWRILLWAPKRARWDESNPPPFTLGLNILYAFVCSLFSAFTPCQTVAPFPPPLITLPGRLLHRREPLLQPARPQQDRRDLLRVLRGGLVRRHPHAVRLRRRPALPVSAGRHCPAAAVHPGLDVGDRPSREPLLHPHPHPLAPRAFPGYKACLQHQSGSASA